MSSAIWSAIVVIWGVVLFPVLVRRHDQHSAQRSVDQFATAMRVLSRRTSDGPGRRWIVVPARSATQTGSQVSAPGGDREVLAGAGPEGSFGLRRERGAGRRRGAPWSEQPPALRKNRGVAPRPAASGGYGEPAQARAQMQRVLGAGARGGADLARRTAVVVSVLASGMGRLGLGAGRVGARTATAVSQRGGRRPESPAVRRRRLTAALLLAVGIALVGSVVAGGRWTTLLLLLNVATVADLMWLRSMAVAETRRRSASRHRAAAVRAGTPAVTARGQLAHGGLVRPAARPERQQMTDRVARPAAAARTPVATGSDDLGRRASGRAARVRADEADPLRPGVGAAPTRDLRPRRRIVLPAEVPAEVVWASGGAGVRIVLPSPGRLFDDLADLDELDQDRIANDDDRLIAALDRRHAVGE